MSCVDLFEFILLGTLYTSCTWISVSFFRFGKFGAIISSNTFSTPSSLLLLESLFCIDWHTLNYPIGLLYCFHFFFFYLTLCLLFWLDNFHYSVVCVYVCVRALSCFSHVWFFAMDCCLLGFSIHGTLQERILEWLPRSPSEDLPDPGIKPASPALQVYSLPTEPHGKPILSCKSLIYSSALFSLLFFAFSSAFISENEHCNFSWFLFIVICISINSP